MKKLLVILCMLTLVFGFAFTASAKKCPASSSKQQKGLDGNSPTCFTCFICHRRPEPPPQSVPEPATMLLFGSGLIGLAGVAVRKFKKK